MTTQPDQELYDFLSNRFSRNPERRLNAVLFTHRQADPDALCAAAALSLLLRKLFGEKIKSIRIVAPQGASALGVSVCKTLGIEFQETAEEEVTAKADLLFALDVGDKTLLDPFLNQFEQSGGEKILIDHHGTSKFDLSRGSGAEKNGALLVDAAFVDRKATSTCEVVTRNFPEGLMDKRISDILLVGLLFDSQHLGIATARTLEAALTLLRHGAEIESAKGILRTRPDRSEIIARLKAAQRLKFIESKRYLFVYSEVSSFQASVARMLVDIGADVGIAYGAGEKEARISVRSTQRFFKDTGIDLGSLLSEISKSSSEDASENKPAIVMSGGGHSTAASLTGSIPKPDVLIEEILHRLQDRLPL